MKPVPCEGGLEGNWPWEQLFPPRSCSIAQPRDRMQTHSWQQDQRDSSWPRAEYCSESGLWSSRSSITGNLLEMQNPRPCPALLSQKLRAGTGNLSPPPDDSDGDTDMALSTPEPGSPMVPSCKPVCVPSKVALILMSGLFSVCILIKEADSSRTVLDWILI